ncbi:MAG TPA: thiamine-binding protein [Tissierellia bacterium]|nr:thiamine-binding protein [Tissierellia bacterium]
MEASVAIQVLPQVEGNEEVVRVVDSIIDYIKSTGLNYYVGPFETTIEGNYNELMEIVKNCQLIAVKEGAPSVISYVKIFFNPNGGVLTIEEKISKHHQ